MRSFIKTGNYLNSMILTRRAKILLSIGVIVIVAGVATPLITISVLNHNTVTLTLLDNAGVMIEARGSRLYIDPINLPDSYADKPADAILITHPHGDHYEYVSISKINTESTVHILPDNMSIEVAMLDGVGLDPEDTYQVGIFNIQAFYMYTLPVGEFPASHPQEANWTSYLVTVNGLTIFHAGDSKNIDEYEQLTGLVDIALLPLGPGCQTMADMEIVDVLDVIQPKYFIPIHYSLFADYTFIETYGDLITNCEIIRLEYFTSHKFR